MKSKMNYAVVRQELRESAIWVMAIIGMSLAIDLIRSTGDVTAVSLIQSMMPIAMGAAIGAAIVAEMTHKSRSVRSLLGALPLSRSELALSRYGAPAIIVAAVIALGLVLEVIQGGSPASDPNGPKVRTLLAEGAFVIIVIAAFRLAGDALPKVRNKPLLIMAALLVAFTIVRAELPSLLENPLLAAPLAIVLVTAQVVAFSRNQDFE